MVRAIVRVGAAVLGIATVCHRAIGRPQALAVLLRCRTGLSTGLQGGS